MQKRRLIKRFAGSALSFVLAASCILPPGTVALAAESGKDPLTALTADAVSPGDSAGTEENRASVFSGAVTVSVGDVSGDDLVMPAGTAPDLSSMGQLVYDQPFNDGTSLLSMNKITNGSHALSLTTGSAAHAESPAGGGDAYWLSPDQNFIKNGVVSVDLSMSAGYRAGVMFRAADIHNYTWIGFAHSGALLIREIINDQNPGDTVVPLSPAANQSVNMTVEFYEDEMRIYLDGTKVFDGKRPHAEKRGDAAGAAVSGTCGIMGWDEFSANYDNLRLYKYAPSVKDVAAAGLTAKVIEGRNITLTFGNDTDLRNVDLTFTTDPAGAAVLPAGPQDISNGKQVKYTVRLADGSSAEYTITANQNKPGVYVNPFTDNANHTLNSILTTTNSTLKVEYPDGTAKLSQQEAGDIAFLDTASPVNLNGVVSVDYKETGDQWRSGLLFRAKENGDFTWFAVLDRNTLLLREQVDGTGNDVAVNNLTLPNNGKEFRLKVYYYGDYLLAYADDTLIYNGERPQVAAANANNKAAVPGGIGISGWSTVETVYDNLRYDPFEPLVVSAGSKGEVKGGTITYTFPSEDGLNAFTPQLTVFPGNAQVTPAGPQDFTTADAKANGIKYTVGVDGISTEYTVKAVSMADQLAEISNDKMKVQFNRGFPAPYSYELTDVAGGAVFGGAELNRKEVLINGKAYTPGNVTCTEDPTGTKLSYHVELQGVEVGSAAKTVAFDVNYELSGTDLVMTIENVTGDEQNERLQITLDTPVISLDGSTPGAQIAYGGQGGSNGGNIVSIDGGSLHQGSTSYVFLASDKAAAAVYTQDQWNRPYTAKITNNIGEIYSAGYHYRLSDGVRPVKDVTANTTAPIAYKQTVHICTDENGSGSVDWQDAALWTRKQIPQMPASVREFFNGGSWMQTHCAFPGNGNNGWNAVNNYSGFTTVYSEFDQLLETQRQIYNMTDGIGKSSFEVVGWNGRGHDYGWPSINEVYFNPALGTDGEFRQAQLDMKKYGGDLSFHTNMTDMCDNSPTYLREAGSGNPFGDRGSSTGTLQYGAGTFGWNAYKNSHFADLSSALNREDAFIGENGRFHAPQFMYSDVMLDYPKTGYTNDDEQYAKFRLVGHYETLGTSLATEYYYSEKRTGGMYLMKNYQKPNPVDQFINAAQTIFNDTRNVNIQAQDYIFASVYSDVNRDGNFNIAGSGSGNAGSKIQTETTFLLSYLNGYVGKNDLLAYVNENGEQYTQWSNGVKYGVDGNRLTVTKDGKTVALLTLSGGKISGDSFIPAYDGTGRVFAFSTAGGSKTWDLTSEVAAHSFKLYRLTENGRVFVKNVTAQNGKVTLDQEPGTAYVLDYSDSAGTLKTVENLALTSDVTASSNEKRGLWSDYITTAPIPSESLYVTKPDKSAWVEQEDALLKDLTSKMFADGDASRLRYFRFIISGYAADGIENTYWIPKSGEEAWIQFAFPGKRQLAEVAIRHDSDVDELDVTLTDNAGNVIYEGMAGKNFAYTLPEAMTDVEAVKLTIRNADSASVKLCEVGLFSDIKDNVKPTMSVDLGGASVIDPAAGITVTFSEVMTGTPAVTVQGGSGQETAAAVLAADGRSMTVTPQGLKAGAQYTFTVDGITDLSGNALETNTFTVTTKQEENPGGARQELTDALQKLDGITADDAEKETKVQEILNDIQGLGLSSGALTQADADKLADMEAKIAALLGTGVEIKGNGSPGFKADNLLLSIPAGQNGVLDISLVEVPSMTPFENLKLAAGAKAYQLTLGISGNSGKYNLKVPARLWFPLPETVDSAKEIVIVHIKDDGSSELLSGQLVEVDGVMGYEVYANSFSTFVIANKAADANNGGGNNGGGNNGGDNNGGNNNGGDNNGGSDNGGKDSNAASPVKTNVKKSPATYDNSLFTPAQKKDGAERGNASEQRGEAVTAAAAGAAQPANGWRMLLLTAAGCAAAVFGVYTYRKRKKEGEDSFI